MKNFVKAAALILALVLTLTAASAALADGFRTLDEIRESGQMSDETEKKLKAALEDYTRDFLKAV